MRTGLESRYFSRRSSTQILVRQVILALVRLPTLPVLCWFATRQTHLYPVAGIVVAMLILPYGIYLLRSEKERAL
jgi:ABC-type Fe3+-siderophore transport system permease subunit